MGKLSNNKQILVIGQSPPQNLDSVPYNKTRLYEWLSTIGLSKEFAVKNFEYCSVASRFPGKEDTGKDKQPSKEDILENHGNLKYRIFKTNPGLVITVGIVASKTIFENENLRLDEIVGNSYELNPFNCLKNEILVVPLPHPSGGSPWVYLKENHELLSRALSLIKGWCTIHYEIVE